MTTKVHLPIESGLESYTLGRYPAVPVTPGQPTKSRVAYAAAHIVARVDDGSEIDWDATLAFRSHLWSLGLGVADALDTAQRGMGLSTGQAKELIERSAAEAPKDARLVCGISTDELEGGDHSLVKIRDVYLSQMNLTEAAGVAAVMMASRALAATAAGPDDYAHIYREVLGQSGRPVILHWLGPMFDPALGGYWGHQDPFAAMESLLEIVAENHKHIDGIKISMLDEQLEIEFRRRLPENVRCYTGDDFNYPGLIEGDGQHHSDALLGIFEAIAPVAAAALRALDDGDSATYRRLIEPTVALSRHIFEAPTYNYKTGLVFLAYLNGHQEKFRMLGGFESARSAEHLGELVRLADRAGLFPDPEATGARVSSVMTGLGVEVQ